VPLDDQREWFRYHQLFRQLLQHQLERLHQPSDMPNCIGEPASGSPRTITWRKPFSTLCWPLTLPAPAQIIAQQRHVLMNQDEWRRLEILLQVLPHTIVEMQPELILTKAVVCPQPL